MFFSKNRKMTLAPKIDSSFPVMIQFSLPDIFTSNSGRLRRLSGKAGRYKRLEKACTENDWLNEYSAR